MLGLLLVWAALLVALIALAIGRPGKSGALTLGYVLGLSMIHVSGVLPFLASDSDLVHRDHTQLGFEMTIRGLATFLAGAILARGIDQRCAAVKGAPPHRQAQAFGRLGGRALTLGVIAQFVLAPLATAVPTLTSMVAGWATLLILGFWLVLYAATAAADWRRALVTLALLPLLPLGTLVMGGFLGYGTYWVLSIIAFLFVISRRRIWFYAGAPPVLFLSLSLFVTYMGQRADIRAHHDEDDLFSRLDRLSSIITEFELLDLTNPAHVAALDNRLNQNVLVAAGIEHHEAGLSDFAYGATVPLWALIPRALWPDKPQIGGGGDVVTDFTGIPVAFGTSFGTGQVLEFYINFGVPGVLIGFFGLGYLLMWLDLGITRALGKGDMRGLLLRGMPGLILLNAEANLLEIIVGGIAAYVAAHLLIWLRVFAPTSAPRPAHRGGRVWVGIRTRTQP